MLTPISFAQDLNETSADVVVVNDVSSNIVQYGEDDEVYIKLDETEINITEDETAEITGDVHVDVFDGAYPFELTVGCSYLDADNVLREYTTLHDGYGFTFNTGDFEGLKARESPYILTISVVKDDLYEDNLMNDYWWIDGVPDETVTLTVKKDAGPVIPTPASENFTIKGQIYVSDSEGNDSFNGSQAAPFQTIQRALDENKALGGSYEIIVNEGEYYLQNAYDISNNVRITGKGKVIISNEGQGYMFFLVGTNIWEFNNLTIKRGTEAAISGSSTYGGSGNAGKVLNIYNCTFDDNYGLVGVIVSYSKTTIFNSTFTNNQATGTSGVWQGLISARDGSLTVNYCNFYENKVVDGKPIIYSDVKTNANYNFWGNNSGPLSTDISSNVNVKTWVGVLPHLNDKEFVTGQDYNITVEYKYTNGSGEFKDFNVSMPKIDINVEAKQGNLTPQTVTVSGAVNTTYKTDSRGYEKISVKLGDVELSYIEFNVKAPLGDRIYVALNGSDSNRGGQDDPLKSIKAAILKNKELGGDKTIIIQPGEYDEFELEITDKVTILAEKENTVTINALENGRILVVDSDANITNITFKNGFIDTFDENYGYGGAIFHNSGKLTITNCVFEDNTALNGGAIGSWAASEDVLEIFNSTFNANTIYEYSNDFKGSAIFSQSNIVIDNCEFTNNGAGDAYGTVYLGESANITGSIFTDNRACEGAAIYVEAGNKANINIKNNVFTSNKADKGGAVYVALSNTTAVENNTFYQNTADKGGALYLYGKSSKNIVVNNTFTDNSIYLRLADAAFEDNTITNDDAQIIIDGGYISTAVLTFLKNETVKAENGSIEINATLSDDNGNLIEGGEITFTSEGVNIGKASAVNGSASITHYFSDGSYVISGNYSNAVSTEIYDGLLRVNVKNYWFINETGYETLEEAINASQTDDIIMGVPGEYFVDEIQVGHRTRPDEPWVINKQFTLTSLSDEPITLRALGENIFNIDFYSNVTFKNIIFTGARNPDGWGGAVYSMGHNTINVDNCTFIDNYAYSGAAIHTWGGLNVNNTLFIDNVASVYGGAVFKDSDGDLVIENTRFVNNTAYTYAGALYTMGYSDISQLIRNVVFDGNDATCAGAFFTAGKNVTVIDCNFTNNRAIDKNSGYEPCGGAVYVHMGATNFTNVNFTNNYAEGTGGALQLDNSLSSVVDSDGRHKTIYWAILNNCIIENNTALGDGGAFYSGEFNTYVNVTDSVIKNNTARNAALFVSLYSFYTLDNVVIENNRNTAGDCLVYSYGMYSLIESYYANSTITNCTFKNNDASIVFKPTNEYASVNVSECTFEECGAIISSIDANVILTANTEISPKANYSAINKGNLSLDKNSFINPIFTSGVIDTPTLLVIMDNETVTGEIGENMTLTAVMYDDNGNVIVGPNVVFVINSTIVSSKLENDTYVADYAPQEYLEIVNAVTGDLGLLDLNIKTATIKGFVTPVIIADDVEFNLTGKLNVSLADKKGNPIENANLTVTVDNGEYNVTTDKNGFASVDLQLKAGKYEAVINFSGTEYLMPASKTVNVTVNKLSSFVIADIGEAKVGENIPVRAIVPNDATGNVTVNVGGKDFTFIVKDAIASGYINNLTLGSYNVTVTYNGDVKYGGASEILPITVVKCESYVQITVKDIIVGNNAVVNLEVPADATGNIIVSADKDYLVDVNNGGAVVEIPALEVGSYKIEATYLGDSKYLDSSNKTTFNVLKTPVRPTVIEITTIDNGGSIAGVLKDIGGGEVAGAVIIYSVNGVNGTVITNAEGGFNITAFDNSRIELFYRGNDELLAANTTIVLKDITPVTKVKVASQFDIPNRSITINGYAVDTDAGEEGIYYANALLDANGKPIANAYIEFAVNNKIYNRTTYENGSFAPYKLNMIRAGRYTMAFNFAGDENYTNAFACVCVDLDKKPITIKASAKSYKASVKTKKYTVALSTIAGSSHDGKVYLKSGLKVTLTVNGKTYTSKTNSKGQATFKITNLKKKGKFTAKITYNGDKTYEDATKSVKLTIK